MARLIKYAQENIYNKLSCRYYKKVLPLRNQLHLYLREEYQKQLHRRSLYSPIPLPVYSLPLPIPRILLLPPEENRVLLLLSSPPIYRILSPPPPIYKVAKNYLTINDLFRIFRRRSARSSAIPTSARSSTVPTTPIAPRHISIRHRGRRLAEKGDRSTKIAKYLK